MSRRPLFDQFLKAAQQALVNAKKAESEHKENLQDDLFHSSISDAVIYETKDALDSFEAALRNYKLYTKNPTDKQREDLSRCTIKMFELYLEQQVSVGLLSIDDKKEFFKMDKLSLLTGTKPIQEHIEQFIAKQESNLESNIRTVFSTNTNDVGNASLKAKKLRENLEALRAGFKEFEERNKLIEVLTRDKKGEVSWPSMAVTGVVNLFNGASSFLATVAKTTAEKSAKGTYEGYKAGLLLRKGDDPDTKAFKEVALMGTSGLYLILGPTIGPAFGLAAGFIYGVMSGVKKGAYEAWIGPSEVIRKDVLKGVELAQQEFTKLQKDEPTKKLDDTNRSSGSASTRTLGSKEGP